MKILINEDGELEAPALHDTELIGFDAMDIQNQQNLSLRLLNEENEAFDFNIIGLSTLIVKNLREQNVIREVVILDKTNLKKNFNSYEKDFGASFIEVQSSMESPSEIKLVHFIPSVGAEIILLCKRFEITKVT